VLAAALAVAAGTGCGGDGGSDAAADAGTSATTAAATTSAAPPVETRPEPPPDQGRWARQADEACTPWQRQLDALAPPTDAASLEQWLADALPLVRGQAAAVARLKPPAKPDEARRAGFFVEALQKIEAALTRYLAALRAQDAPAVEAALAEANEAGAEARGYAAALDVTQCGGYSGG
jgi:hypothetical protein